MRALERMVIYPTLVVLALLACDNFFALQTQAKINAVQIEMNAAFTNLHNRLSAVENKRR